MLTLPDNVFRSVMATHLVWFRADLRINDNLALAAVECPKFVHRMFFSHNQAALPWSCDPAALAP